MVSQQSRLVFIYFNLIRKCYFKVVDSKPVVLGKGGVYNGD